MKKYLWLALVLAAGVVVLYLAGMVVLYLATSAVTADEATDAKVVTTASGLKYQDLKVGDGDAAKAGDMVQVDYTGWLTADGTTKGKKFDSSLDAGKPFVFTLGAGKVIKGWDEGVAGMKVGGQRRLIIPSDLGYGDDGSGPIPPKATLIFDVELHKIK